MKKLVTIIALVVAAQLAKGQEGYVSNDNAVGDWTSASSWTKSASWLGDVPPNPVNGSTDYVDVFGVINQGSGLEVSGGSTLTVYDTLIVNGNLVLSGGGDVIVENGGVLVVHGDYNGSGGTVTTNGGRAVITGDLSITGGADVVNNASGTDGFYLYGTASRSGGAKFNGSNDPAASNFQDESGLQSNDPSLYSLVNVGVLPVEFLYAKAALVDGGGVQVSWATASELNNDFFVVERSTDGVNYTAIRTVDGAGNSEEVLTYETRDGQVIAGTYFYRVKQVDFDGQFDYSEIARVEVAGAQEFDLKAYPNPTHGAITLEVSSQDMAVKIVVRSMQGEVKQVVESTGLSIALDLSSFPKGYYIVEAYQGQQKKILKVVLN